MGIVEQMFDGMEKAEGFGTGQYFEEGRFELVTKSFKLVTSKRPENAGKHFFTVEFDVTSSSNPNIEIGSSRTYQVKIEGNTYAFGDIKNFVFALIGVDPKNAPSPQANPGLHKRAADIVKALCDAEYAQKLAVQDPAASALVGELVGMPVRLEAFKKAMRTKPGQMFTVHTWSPAPAPAAAD